ncbi:VENN motif pre-toxin domain-containing protein, partial [Gilliamella apicola]|uniref:VENN motif pre-toxin domain-containing protein n=2 Tax=Gilliamella apicola TaxID=1196095 RepID=UPI000A8356AC
MVVGSNVFSPTSGQPTIYDHNDEASNITHAAISDGELIIRDPDKQTQDINELSHDTENAHSKLKPIFNKEDEQTRLNIVTSLKELGEQVKELERTIHKDAGKDSQDGKMGNDFSKGVDSAVSIITGIITGDMTGGLAGASAPWLAEQIKIQAGDNETARLVAHAILGAVVAELQGNSALSGGAGAVAGEVAADIIRKQLYGKEVKDLTEEEKQTISALSQLASGLAVAAGGGNIGDASAAISSSKNAVENNYLSVNEAKRKAYLTWIKPNYLGEELTEDEKKELENLNKLDKERDQILQDNCSLGNISSSACKGLLQEAWEMQNEYEKEVARSLTN